MAELGVRRGLKDHSWARDEDEERLNNESAWAIEGESDDPGNLEFAQCAPVMGIHLASPLRDLLVLIVTFKRPRPTRKLLTLST
jgi:hypothetical protein